MTTPAIVHNDLNQRGYSYGWFDPEDFEERTTTEQIEYVFERLGEQLTPLHAVLQTDGFIPLHNGTDDVICLFCVRPDPLGGGTIMVANVGACSTLTESEINDRIQCITLGENEGIFIDQSTTLFGRLPLGLGQENVPDDQRRLVLQAFGRRIDD